MTDTHFNEEDKQKVVEFLNLIAKHAKFSMDTSELIQYFKSLSYMQQKLLVKVEANIFEVKRIVESNEPIKEESKLKGKK
jgi:hypothetical protein